MRTTRAICGCQDAARHQDDPRTSHGSRQDATHRQDDLMVNPQDPAGHLRMPGRYTPQGRTSC